MASNILLCELRKHGVKGSYLPGILDEIGSKDAPEILEMADMFLAFGLIYEAQAVFLEELILRDLGFDTAGYVDLKKEANPYCRALEKRGKEGTLCYIGDWCQPQYYRTSFIKTFLRCFGRIRVDKFTTQWEKVDQRV